MECYLENLPYELSENIFKYLELDDFLNLSLVSKSMNAAIGRSNFCMNKIWIKFYSFNLKDFSSLNESVRNYEKLKINRIKSEEHFNFLIQLQKGWKKVLIYNCEFKSFKMFFNLIDSLAESIEEIEVSDIEILCYDQEILPLKFPSLKRFMLRNVPSKILEIFSLSSNRLTAAAFDIPQLIEGENLQKFTHEILKASPKLKLLQLGPQYLKDLFKIYFEYKFRLESLLLKFPIVNDLSDEEVQNISKFLTEQNCINWLTLMELQNDKILSSAWNNSRGRISFIGIEDLFNSEMEIEIEPNFKITQMDFITRRVLISQLRKFLKAAPLVINIHVKLLNKHMLELIAKTSSSIRTLFYEHIEENGEEIYENLKQQEEVNKEIKLVQKSFWFNNEIPFSIDPTFWRK